MMHGRKNKENCTLKLVDEIILYYDARSKKHQILWVLLFLGLNVFMLDVPHGLM